MKIMYIAIASLFLLPVCAQTCYLDTKKPDILKQIETVERNARRKRVIALELKIVGIQQQQKAAKESLEYLAGVNISDRDWYTPRVQESLRALESMMAPVVRELERERGYVAKYNQECPKQASEWEITEAELNEMTGEIALSLMPLVISLPSAGLLTEAEVRARRQDYNEQQAAERRNAQTNERKLTLKNKLRLGLLAVLIEMAETSANMSCTYVNGKLVGCATISGNSVRITTPHK